MPYSNATRGNVDVRLTWSDRVFGWPAVIAGGRSPKPDGLHSFRAGRIRMPSRYAPGRDGTLLRAFAK